MTSNRNSKKWKELYRNTLLANLGIEDSATWFEKKEAFSNAMPDRIKEAEEYADRLYEAMR